MYDILKATTDHKNLSCMKVKFRVQIIIIHVSRKLVLLYGSQTLTIKASDVRRITAAEMKYMRRTAAYTWTDYKTNAQISKELNKTNFGQIAGIQGKLDTTCKYNTSK